MLKVCKKSAGKLVGESPQRVTEHAEITTIQEVHEQKIIVSQEILRGKHYTHLMCFSFLIAPIYGTGRHQTEV